MSYPYLMVTHSLLNDSKCIDNTLCLNYCPFKDVNIPTYSNYYSLAIKFNILSLSKFYLFSFGFVCRGKGHLQMTDFDYISPCITFLLYCTSEVNVSFEDVLNHVTKYFLTCFTLNRNRHMIASVSSQCQNCDCT